MKHNIPLCILVAYMAVICIIGFVLPIIDKKRAKKGAWRISEKSLVIVSALGGSISMYISMLLFHHKTKHKRFMIGIPLIIILQLSACFLIFFFVKK